ncbi:EamA family transporter [Pseudomonas asuensis]|uniref:EamA family transporter n=1 Tax=Pseudomonas asuensis TaxID=1825787 RepID=UPI0035709E73
MFIGIAVKDFPPLCIVTLRTSQAALVLLGLTYLLHLILPKDRNTWVSFLAISMLDSVIPFSLIVWARTSIKCACASIMFKEMKRSTAPYLFGL